MKLRAEIKDGEFVYKYRVGLSKQEGHVHLSANNLLIFCKLLEFCACVSDRDSKAKLDKITNEIGAKAWIDEHQIEASDYVNKIADQNQDEIEVEG